LYNSDHKHSGIRYVSPAQRHSGEDRDILAARHALYVRESRSSTTLGTTQAQLESDHCRHAQSRARLGRQRSAYGTNGRHSHLKLYGHSGGTDTDEAATPSALAEITLVASPSELRRIAQFLSAAASNMDRMGIAYSHEHLSDWDWDRSFALSPHFVVAPPASDEE
jgi:hypothetical protein